jgi:thiamine-monophosphate kinase
MACDQPPAAVDDDAGAAGADSAEAGADTAGAAGADTGGEFAFLRRLRGALSGRERPGELYLGDDAAVLLPPSGKLLFATDIVVEGVHFDLRLGSAADAAAKAISVNVSDIAAMGGRPTHLVAAVGAPGWLALDEVFAGFEEAAGRYGVALVGGDLSGSDRLVISVAVIGDSGELAPVTRAGARPSDLLWCTGPLGGSAAGLELLLAGLAGLAGLAEEAAGSAGDPAGAGGAPQELIEAYRRPVARPAEGLVAARIGATAMIDISDGLAGDVRHIAEESKVGVELDDVPVALGATEAQALGGGEDLELVFAAPPEIDVAGAFVRAGLRPPFLLGRCVGDVGVLTLRGGALPRAGWVHRVGS